MAFAPKFDEKFNYTSLSGDRFTLSFSEFVSRYSHNVRFWIFISSAFVLLNIVMPQNYFSNAALSQKMLYWAIMLCCYAVAWFATTYVLCRVFSIGKGHTHHQLSAVLLGTLVVVLLSERVTVWLGAESLSLITNSNGNLVLSFLMEYFVDLMFILAFETVEAFLLIRVIFHEYRIVEQEHPWLEID